MRPRPGSVGATWSGLHRAGGWLGATAARGRARARQPYSARAPHTQPSCRAGCDLARRAPRPSRPAGHAPQRRATARAAQRRHPAGRRRCRRAPRAARRPPGLLAWAWSPPPKEPTQQVQRPFAPTASTAPRCRYASAAAAAARGARARVPGARLTCPWCAPEAPGGAPSSWSRRDRPRVTPIKASPQALFAAPRAAHGPRGRRAARTARWRPGRPQRGRPGYAERGRPCGARSRLPPPLRAGPAQEPGPCCNVTLQAAAPRAPGSRTVGPRARRPRSQSGVILVPQRTGQALSARRHPRCL